MIAHMNLCACGNSIKNYRAKVCVTCRNRAINAARRVTYDRAYVEKWSEPDGGGCWIWQGSTDFAGYGKVSRKSGEALAHRLAYRVFIGPINNEIDHTCYRPACVFPGHLQDVSASENSSRRRNVLEARQRTACKHGHPWTEYSTIWRGTTRVCRVCGNLARNKTRAQRRHDGTSANPRPTVAQP